MLSDLERAQEHILELKQPSDPGAREQVLVEGWACCWAARRSPEDAGRSTPALPAEFRSPPVAPGRAAMWAHVRSRDRTRPFRQADGISVGGKRTIQRQVADVGTDRDVARDHRAHRGAEQGGLFVRQQSDDAPRAIHRFAQACQQLPPVRRLPKARCVLQEVTGYGDPVQRTPWRGLAVVQRH